MGKNEEILEEQKRDTINEISTLLLTIAGLKNDIDSKNKFSNFWNARLELLQNDLKKFQKKLGTVLESLISLQANKEMFNACKISVEACISKLSEMKNALSEISIKCLKYDLTSINKVTKRLKNFSMKLSDETSNSDDILDYNNYLEAKVQSLISSLKEANQVSHKESDESQISSDMDDITSKMDENLQNLENLIISIKKLSDNNSNKSGDNSKKSILQCIEDILNTTSRIIGILDKIKRFII